MTMETNSGQLTSVLLVEDSRVQRDHVARLCRGLGIVTIHEASNGLEALSLLDSLAQPPGLVIMDLEMPTMDGAELLEQLQQRGIDLPIIVASTHERTLLNSMEDMGGVLGLRIVGALQKPLKRDALSRVLGSLAGITLRRLDETQWPVDAESLSAALERREILVHYQPKVEIGTGVVQGVEALARWKHPTLGFVPPERFIPLAERAGLIHQLTLQVMNHAMLHATMWNAHGRGLSVAINLSALLLERSDLAQEIVALQRCHGIPANQIVFELTESALATRPAVALGILVRLRLRGFGLSLDDYGTGFSSMQQLARMPFTELKIDRSLVHGAHERGNFQVILRSALDLAKQLHLVSVAEGVETEQDWLLLRELGCALGQGHWIADPMPPEKILPWLETQRRREPGSREPFAAGNGNPTAA